MKSPMSSLIEPDIFSALKDIGINLMIDRTAVAGKTSPLSVAPHKRGIVTLAVQGDGGLFSCFFWLPGQSKCVQCRFEDSPGRKRPKKDQKMIVRLV